MGAVVGFEVLLWVLWWRKGASRGKRCCTVVLELGIVLLKGSDRDGLGVAVKGGRTDCDNGGRIGTEGETVVQVLVEFINVGRVARGRGRRGGTSWFGEDKVGTEALSKATRLSPSLHSSLDGGGGGRRRTGDMP